MRFSTVVIILSFCLACAYDPDEVNYVALNPEVRPSVGMLLQDLPDTLLVLDVVQVTYNFAIQNAPEFYTEAILGTSEIHSAFSASSGSFEINPAEFPEGYHTLSFNVHTRSFTESLADISGVERILFSKQIVVNIYKAPAEPMNIASVEHRDGTVYVNWPAYPRPNLRKYVIEITRYYPAEFSSDKMYSRNVTVSADATSFRDSTALGNKTVYRLFTHTTIGDVVGGEHYTDAQTTLPRMVDFETVNKSQVNVIWTKSPYYNNLTSYVVTTSLIKEDISNADVQDTTASLTSQAFGAPFPVSLYMKSHFNYNGYTSDRFTWVYMGRKIHKAYHYAFSVGSATPYYVNGDYFGKLDGEGNGMDSVEVTWTTPVAGISRNNEHIFVGTTYSLFEIDAETLEKKSWISIGDFYAGRAYSPVVTNANHLYFVHYHSIYSYDVAAQMAPDTIHRSSFITPFNLRLSADETFLVENDNDGVRLLTVQNKRFVKDEYLGFAGYQGYFISNDNSNVYLTNGNVISVFNLTTRVATDHIDLPYSFKYHLFDLKNDWIAGIDEEKKYLVVYDIKSGALNFKVPVAKYIDPSAFFIHDGKLYSNEGYILSFQ